MAQPCGRLLLQDGSLNAPAHSGCFQGRTQGQYPCLSRRHQPRTCRPRLDLQDRRSDVIGVGSWKRWTSPTASLIAPLRRLPPAPAAWAPRQQANQNSCETDAHVAIEFGTCRCERNGSSSGPISWSNPHPYHTATASQQPQSSAWEVCDLSSTTGRSGKSDGPPKVYSDAPSCRSTTRFAYLL